MGLSGGTIAQTGLHRLTRTLHLQWQRLTLKLKTRRGNDRATPGDYRNGSTTGRGCNAAQRPTAIT